MRLLLSPLLLLSLVLGGLTGCSSSSTIMANGLRVDLTQIKRDASGAVQVTWRFSNPNVVSYLFSKSQHKLSLDGTTVGMVEDGSAVGLPASSQVDRTGTLVSSGPAADQAIAQALARGTASYQLTATVWVLIIDDDYEKISLGQSGTVPVSVQ